MIRIRFFAIAIVLLDGPQIFAGFYHKDVIARFDLDKQGYADPLSFEGFLSFLRRIEEVDNAKTGLARELMQTIRERKQKGVDNLSLDEKIALSSDLLRFRQNDVLRNEAIDLLQPLTRRPPAGQAFFILMNQSHAYVLRGEFKAAYDLAYSALTDYGYPRAIYDLSAEELRWYEGMERNYYLPFLRHRQTETSLRKASLQDGLDPLFPSPARGKVDPVRFENAQGEYQVGGIAPAELAKLPPDAIAIVQQMILWNPSDSRLVWQLAELYNAVGDLRASTRFFEMCVNELKNSHPELMKHRRLVLSAWNEQQLVLSKQEEARRLEEETKKQAAEEAKRQAISEERQRQLMIGAGVVVVLVVISYWQTREFIRRLKARRLRAANQTNQVF